MLTLLIWRTATNGLTILRFLTVVSCVRGWNGVFGVDNALVATRLLRSDS